MHPRLKPLFTLPVNERLRLVEELWDSIAKSPESVPVTAAQKRELDRGLAAHRKNPGGAKP